jgi:uncharacterized coiled-coil protein SlyX
MQPAADLETLAARVTNLETLFTHLERQLTDFNLVVLAQSQKLERAEQQLARLLTPPEEDDELGTDEL